MIYNTKENYMATRCTIKVEGIKFCKVYKHWDGYPEHMLPWLEAFNSMFTKDRGVDPEYKLAQLLRFAAVNAEEYGLDLSETTGWGIVSYSDNCGADYEYTLNADGSVKHSQIN